MIESLLGLHVLVKDRGVIIHNFPIEFVEFLHDWCLFVYRYNQSIAWKNCDGEVFAKIRLVAEREDVQTIYLVVN